MSTDETIPWINYKEGLSKFEERGKTKGMAIGRAYAYREIAKKAFERNKHDMAKTARELNGLGIPDDAIKDASSQFAVLSDIPDC